MSKTISFVFPVYKNEASLGELYSRVKAVMAAQAKGMDFTMVFVVDGSPDGSLDILKKLAAEDARVHVVSLSRNFGHQAAVTAGLDRAQGDAVIVMDADLQDPPALCKELIEQWQKGYDVVYAQRKPRKDYSWFKRTLRNAYYGLLARMSSVDIPRNVGDFRLMDKKVVAAIRNMPEYHRFLRGLVAYAGFKQIAVQFDRDPRFDEEGSSYSLKKLIQLAKDGILGFSDVPLRIIIPVGLVGLLLSLLAGAYTMVGWLFGPQFAVPGVAIIMITILFVGSVQLIAIGTVAEYIGRTYDEVRKRPTYIVAEEISQDGKKT